MKFRGWPEQAFDFYARLELDNTKTFWQANRSIYDEAVREPFDALSDLVEGEYGRLRAASAAPRIVAAWSECAPMNEWLARHVGPSTLAPPEPD